MYVFNTATITRRLARLPWPASAAFAAACAQRLFTGYERYAVETVQGSKPLAAALDELWAGLAGRPVNFEELADQCEELVPDTLNEWSLAAQYAEDAVAATVYALRCAASRDPADAIASANRAYESVDAILQEELDLDFSRPGGAEMMRAHPQTQAELSRQERDLVELEGADDLREALLSMRQRAAAEPIH
jgi:uncharacterized protein YjaG (DUF416 family)